MSNEVYDLKWGHDLAMLISGQIKTEIGRIRSNPPLIPIVPGGSRYEDVVQSYRIDVGPPFTIRPNSKLAPIRISSRFVLAQQQFSDQLLATRLALRPASDLAFAEDAILLHGSRAAPTLKDLHIEDENGTLGEQDGLFENKATALPAGRDVFESIREALEALQKNKQHGPYCVVVSPDLHREAITPVGTGTTPRINPILPQLREHGFRISEAATPRTGVAFSLGGAALDMAVLWDSHVECRKVEGDATFVVVQQFRLRINDRRAVVALT
jgi:uncharacterized linocin/CFP29 family protein